MAESEEPRIFVDSDWKQQAQAEKARLAEQEQSARDEPEEGELPPASIIELVRMLASQALMGLGSRDPQTGQIVVALDLSKFHIDLLEELESKTKGNLTDEESQLISQTLSELRMIFADTQKAVAQAVKEGKIAQAPPGMQPGQPGQQGPQPGGPMPPSSGG